MHKFTCTYKGKTKVVEARYFESACKKAFRSPSGYHWKSVVIELAYDYHCSVSRDDVTLFYVLEDNG